MNRGRTASSAFCVSNIPRVKSAKASFRIDVRPGQSVPMIVWPRWEGRAPSWAVNDERGSSTKATARRVRESFTIRSVQPSKTENCRGRRPARTMKQNGREPGSMSGADGTADRYGELFASVGLWPTKPAVLLARWISRRKRAEARSPLWPQHERLTGLPETTQFAAQAYR